MARTSGTPFVDFLAGVFIPLVDALLVEFEANREEVAGRVQLAAAGAASERVVERVRVPKLLRYMAAEPAEIIAAMLRVLYPDAETALDATWGRGKFWAGSADVRVIGLDLGPHGRPHVLGDFRALPFGDGAFDVVAFDPPHNGDAGKHSIMGQRFGTYKGGALEAAIHQGCREAMRVCCIGAIVKVTDQVHGAKFQRLSGWVIDELGEPFDVVYGIGRPTPEDPRWTVKGPPLSARNNGAVYLAFRHGDQRHIRRAPTNGSRG